MIIEEIEKINWNGFQVSVSGLLEEGKIYVCREVNPNKVLINPRDFTRIIYRTQKDFNVALQEVKEFYIQRLMNYADSLFKENKTFQ